MSVAENSSPHVPSKSGLPSPQLWVPKSSPVAAQIRELRQQIHEIERHEKAFQRQTNARLQLLHAIEEKRKMATEQKSLQAIKKEIEHCEHQKNRRSVLEEHKRKTQMVNKLEKDFTERVQEVNEFRAELSKLTASSPSPSYQGQRQSLREVAARRRQEHVESLQDALQRKTEHERQQLTLAKRLQMQDHEELTQQVCEQRHQQKSMVKLAAVRKAKELEALRQSEIQRRLADDAMQIKMYQGMATKAQALAQEKRGRAEAVKGALRHVEKQIEG